VGSLHLPSEDDTKGHVFICLYVDDLKKLERKTARKDRTTAITWDQTFKFPLTTVNPSKLHLELIESDDTILGKESIKLGFILKNEGKVTEKTYHLDPSGDITLKLSWESNETTLSKKDKRRSTEVSNSMVGKKTNISDRRTKAKSTKITQALETKEKPKKLARNKQPSNTTTPIGSPTTPIRSSAHIIKSPTTEKERIYPPAPVVNIALKNYDDFFV
jgi:hypothetical protein